MIPMRTRILLAASLLIATPALGDDPPPVKVDLSAYKATCEIKAEVREDRLLVTWPSAEWESGWMFLRLRPGEMLFRQGDAPGGFYGLLGGLLKISSLREDGREAILVVLEAGNWIGEISLMDGEPRTHDGSRGTTFIA